MPHPPSRRRETTGAGGPREVRFGRRRRYPGAVRKTEPVARRSSRPLTLAAVVVALALVAAGCSGGGKGRPGGRATGPPITVGLLNMENGPVGSFPELREGAETAARYVNEELGGVGGRPIQLESCATAGTPESSRACATRIVEKRPVAVVGGVDLAAGASLPVFEKAGIPYIGGSPTSQSELTSAASFMLTGGIASELLGQANYVTRTLKARRVAILHVDLPGLISTAATVARTVLRENGVEDVKIVAEKADAPDFTPALSAAASAKPDVIVVVFPAQGCARIMQARQALNIRARTLYPGACAEKGILDSAGAGAEGAVFATAYLPWSTSSEEDVRTYREALDRHGTGGGEPSILSQTGFSVVVTLRQLLEKAGGDKATPARLTERLKETKSHPNFMGHPFTCDGEQIPILRSMCDHHVRILERKGDTLVDVAGDWVTGADLVRALLD